MICRGLETIHGLMLITDVDSPCLMHILSIHGRPVFTSGDFEIVYFACRVFVISWQLQILVSAKIGVSVR